MQTLGALAWRAGSTAEPVLFVNHHQPELLEGRRPPVTSACVADDEGGSPPVRDPSASCPRRAALAVDPGQQRDAEARRLQQPRAMVLAKCCSARNLGRAP